MTPRKVSPGGGGGQKCNRRRLVQDALKDKMVVEHRDEVLEDK